MGIRGSIAVSVLGVATACAAPGDGAPGRDHDTLRAEVENGLLPAIVLEGEDRPTWTLHERLAHYDVPAVSVAVIDGGEIAWAHAYGVADTEANRPASTETLFQAASISKPAAALAALALVEEGRLSLDAPVNDFLTSWTVPGNQFTADSAVTLRGLLTHSAGLTVWGFPGYRKDLPFSDARAIADNREVLDGEGNTDPVRVYKVPGTSWQYSGGGYTVMELMVEDVTARPFPATVREKVLQPAGMTLSTYAQPLPADRWDEAARGHLGDGSEVEGEWHTYPEQAAAGLWTTPSELARLSVHLLGILDGSVTDGVVSREMLTQMLAPNHGGAEGFNNWGLGFGLGPSDGEARFGHGGSNAGFKANWVVYPDRAQGFAIMSNGDRGSALAAEVGRAIAEAYDWPAWRPETRRRVRPDPDVIASIAGEYVFEGRSDFVVEMRAGEDATLEVIVPRRGTTSYYASSDDEWFALGDGEVIVMERDAQGDVVRAVADGSTVLIRR